LAQQPLWLFADIPVFMVIPIISGSGFSGFSSIPTDIKKEKIIVKNSNKPRRPGSRQI
jgi:hypothetical protein